MALIGVDYNGLLLAVYAMDRRGTVSQRRGQLGFAASGETNDFLDVLNQNPPRLFFRDGNNTFRHSIFKLRATLPSLPKDALERWNWSGVDPRKESKPPGPGFTRNVQTAAIDHFMSRYNNPTIIVDDGANELADIIVIHTDSGRVFVDFVHCKWSHSEQPGRRLLDIYELTSQVARSLRWAHSSTVYTEILRRIKTRKKTIVKVGNVDECIATLQRHAKTPPETLFSAFAVQPGLAMDQLDSWIEGRSLLVSCYTWCTANEVRFSVCGY